MTWTPGFSLLEALGRGGRVRADGARAVRLDPAGEVAAAGGLGRRAGGLVVVAAAAAAAASERRRGPSSSAIVVIVLVFCVHARECSDRPAGTGVPDGERPVKGW